MTTFAAEVLGTFLLILFGNGVVANVALARTKSQNGGWIVITLAWGLAVAIAVYVAGRISGAHLNPAVTLAMASISAFPTADVPRYLLAQFIGAFLGAALTFAYFPSALCRYDRQRNQAGCICYLSGYQQTAE